MFRRLRQEWQELIGRRTGFPPPPLLDDPPALRSAIEDFFQSDRERFRRFFLRGESLRASGRSRERLHEFAAAGLATHLLTSVFTPRVRLFPVGGKFVATDLLGHGAEDQVFSLTFEQVYLLRNMDVRKDEDVLELCVGSGIISLFAADRARGVVAVDRSARALAFARFNAALNGRSLDLREGSLFEPVAGETFDLVLVNPPFEPVPPGTSWFRHSDGGEDGLDVVRSLLPRVHEHLRPDGRFVMITWSPASDDGPELVPMLTREFPTARITVDTVGEEPLSVSASRFRNQPGHDAWRGRLGERGLDRIQMLHTVVEPGADPGLLLRKPEDEIATCWALAADWD